MENENVQKINGTWKGTPISIKPSFGGHEFTAEERTKLFNDEMIEFDAVSSKTGKPYKAKGKIEKYTYQGNEYIGFKLILDNDQVERFSGKWNGQDVNVKRVWSGHRFTDDEVQQLLADKVISFETVSKKTGNKYTAKGKLANQEWNGKPFIGFKPIFDNE